ncbi:MAG: CubicO group peptidase beta-lactamase class family [Sphingomonas bacterium]|nr:CubicO group peptidase beta-lactamase class family [Sphingomonas bacterium]
MKTIAAAFALALAAPAGAVDASRLDRLVDASAFHGVALVGEGNALTWSRAAGEVRPGVPHRLDAVWRLASVTKQLTALIVMQEVAAGRIDLDQPVRAYWPGWPYLHADNVTVRMLLRHQSGLADPNLSRSSAGDSVPDFYRRTGPAARPIAAATGFCAGPPRAAPGESYHYNNCDYIVLGALLEHVTGQPLVTLLRDRIAGPVGAATLGLFDPEAPGTPADVPGLLTGDAPEPGLNLGTYGGAGSAYATPDDLWRFDRALMDNALLDKIATATMWEGDPAIGAAAFGAWAYVAPLAGCPDPARLVERRGAIGGVQLRNFLVPDRRLALILFTNRESFDFGEVWQGRGFAHDMLAAALCPETK